MSLGQMIDRRLWDQKQHVVSLSGSAWETILPADPNRWSFFISAPILYAGGISVSLRGDLPTTATIIGGSNQKQFELTASDHGILSTNQWWGYATTGPVNVLVTESLFYADRVQPQQSSVASDQQSELARRSMDKWRQQSSVRFMPSYNRKRG